MSVPYYIEAIDRRRRRKVWIWYVFFWCLFNYYCLYVCMFVCLYVCMYVRMYACMYVLFVCVLL